MKIHVLLSPQNVDELYFANKTTVVIDVLRATTTIAIALNNGAKEVVPVDSVDFAVRISGDAFSGHTLLAGERNTKKIEGFALGNSPLEFAKEVIDGKSIIFYTTNGSRSIIKAKFSDTLITASFNNMRVVAEYLCKQKNDVEILCSGFNGMFCLEDTICAGLLVLEMEKISGNIEQSDSAKSSVVLAKSFGKNIKKILLDCEHGKLLVANGFEEDVKIASEINSLEVIPYFEAGIMKLLDFPKLKKTKQINKVK